MLESSAEIDGSARVEPALIVGAVVVGVLVVVLVAAVMVRGWRLIRELTLAKRDAYQEAVHTASAEFETRKALEQRDEFIAFMSHELRTPLFSILGTLDELSPELSKEATHTTALIESSAQKMAATLNSVLRVQNIARQAYEVEERPISLDALVKGVCTDHAVTASGKNIELEYKWDNRMPEIIMGDAHVLGTIVHHLVANAIEYTEPHGHVTVSVRRECVGLSLDLRVQQMSKKASNFHVARSVVFASEFQGDKEEERPGVTLRLSVKDTGIGIPPKRLSSLFEPFSCERLASSSRKHGHTELGLPTVKALVTRLGGIIDVTSKLGRGSQFNVAIFLPTEASPPHPVSPVLRSDDPYTRRTSGSMSTSVVQHTSATAIDAAKEGLANQRVLVVDDDDTNRTIIRSMLQSEVPDLHIAEACDGEQALAAVEHADEQGEPFCLVLLDVLLPGASGHEVAASIKGHQTLRQRPIIIGCTGASLESERVRLLACGMLDVLRKPFRRRDLFQIIAKHWRAIEYVCAVNS